MTTFANRLPVREGSRGGRWHDPEYRRAYHRAWRAAHPEYQEREKLRRARQRAQERGNDPANVIDPPSFPRPLPSPALDVQCACGCGCTERIVVECGFCTQGIHEGLAS